MAVSEEHIAMTTDGPATPYESTPTEALAAIASHQGLVLVDLDETLYLSNSTEDFLDSAKPGLIARLALKVLDLLKPWRFTGGLPTRDVWRVGLIVTLFPWVIWWWRKRVGALAAQLGNRELIAALRAAGQPTVIVTVGFRPIVTPLIDALGFGKEKLVSASWFTFIDRLRGKLAMATEALGTSALRTALFITDSIDDLPMLHQSGRALRVIWPEARFRPAFRDVYLPGEYLSKIKRPNSRYILRGVLQEDFAFWILGSIALTSHPFTHVVGLLILLCSFWAIYEHGYVDNDEVAVRYEANPGLSSAFWNTTVSTSAWQAWAWALCAGAAGVFTLQWSQATNWVDYAKWLAVLLATHGCFWLYNRVDKSTRIWLYIFLQFARSAAFLVLVPSTIVGILAIGSHALARWVSYFTYRFTGKDSWPSTQVENTRLMFFAVITVLFVAVEGITEFLNMTTAALFAWCTFRARHELKHIISSATRIDRSKPRRSDTSSSA